VVRTLVPGVRVEVDERVTDAVAALGAVLQAHNYHVRSGDTGAYNCRKITGGSDWSLHAYGIAVDVNWNSNPYRTDHLVTDMPTAMIGDVCRILTKGGHRVWRWGGDWDGNPATPHSNYDAMHFEVVASPAELTLGVDWSTVNQRVPDPAVPSTWPVLHPGDRGPSVAELQRRIGVADDGSYGPNTELAIRQFQFTRGLEADGIVGLATWTAVLTNQPPVGGDVPSPIKLDLAGIVPPPNS
jgi:hypothetical protein